MYRPGVHGWTEVRRLNSTAALIGAVTGSLRRPPVLPLGRYDTTGCLRLAGKTAPLKPRSARDPAAAGPGHSPNGPIMLIWDDLKVHKDAGLEEFTETRDWLTIYYLPALRARPQPRRGHLVTPTARMALQRRLQQPGTPRPGKRPWARAATPGMPRGLGMRRSTHHAPSHAHNLGRRAATASISWSTPPPSASTCASSAATPPPEALPCCPA